MGTITRGGEVVDRLSGSWLTHLEWEQGVSACHCLLLLAASPLLQAQLLPCCKYKSIHVDSHAALHAFP